MGVTWSSCSAVAWGFGARESRDREEAEEITSRSSSTSWVAVRTFDVAKPTMSKSDSMSSVKPKWLSLAQKAD